MLKDALVLLSIGVDEVEIGSSERWYTERIGARDRFQKRLAAAEAKLRVAFSVAPRVSTPSSASAAFSSRTDIAIGPAALSHLSQNGYGVCKNHMALAST